MSEFISKIEHILTLLDDFLFSIMGGRPANIFHSGQKLLWPARMGGGGEGWSLTWNSNRGHKSFRNTNLCHTWTHIGMSCTTISYLDAVGEAGGHRMTLYHQTIGHKMEKNYLHQSHSKISVMSLVEVKLDKVERCLARYSPRRRQQCNTMQ